MGRTDLAGTGYDIASAVEFDPQTWRGVSSPKNVNIPLVSVSISNVPLTYNELLEQDRLAPELVSRFEPGSELDMSPSNRPSPSKGFWFKIKSYYSKSRNDLGSHHRDLARTSSLAYGLDLDSTMVEQAVATVPPTLEMLDEDCELRTLGEDDNLEISKNIRTSANTGILISGVVIDSFLFKSMHFDMDDMDEEEEEPQSHELRIDCTTHILIDYNQLAPPGYMSDCNDVLYIYFLLRKSLKARRERSSRAMSGFARSGLLPLRAVLSIMAFVEPCWFASVWRRFERIDAHNDDNDQKNEKPGPDDPRTSLPLDNLERANCHETYFE